MLVTFNNAWRGIAQGRLLNMDKGVAELLLKRKIVSRAIAPGVVVEEGTPQPKRKRGRPKKRGG